MKKKSICLGLCLALLVVPLCACTKLVKEEPEKISLYATFYPIYALGEMITKDIPELEWHCLVQPQDGCIRSYTLSDWDLYLMNYSADCVFMGGSGLESFHEVLSEHAEIPVAELFYGLDLAAGDLESDEEDSHFNGKNPHLYLSVDGTAEILESLSASLNVLYPKFKDQYEINNSIVQEAIQELKTEIEEKTSVCIGRKTAVLNEMLVYPARDYQMDIVCIIERESGEQFYGDDLQNMLNELKKSGTEIVLIEQQAPLMFKEAIKENGFMLAEMNVMSTLGEKDGIQGYLDVLKNNAEAAAEACKNR